MKGVMKTAVILLVVSNMFVSCSFNNGKKNVFVDTESSTRCPYDMALYQTINDFIEKIDFVAKKEKKNILVVHNRVKDKNIWIDIIVVPAYSYSQVDDSVIIAYTIINDWLVCLYLTPDVFNKYKESFIFVDPNKYPKYIKNYDGAYEPVSWQYQLQNDSFVFVKHERL